MTGISARYWLARIFHEFRRERSQGVLWQGNQAIRPEAYRRYAEDRIAPQDVARGTFADAQQKAHEICGLALIGILVFVVGCRGSSKAAAERNESNLKPLQILYSKYTVSHRGQAPANEKAFKEYIASIPAEQRKRFRAEDVDALFISPRDNKPYKIIYGGQARRGSSDVVAYEQDGIGGKRWVARDLGIVEEVDEARFKELVPNGP